MIRDRPDHERSAIDRSMHPRQRCDADTPPAASSEEGSAPMRPRTTRSLRISDILVLVAATGLGVAGCKLWLSLEGISVYDLWPWGRGSASTKLWLATMWSLPGVSVMLLSWTTSVLLLRLLTPRPPRRRLWLQPGFLACVAAIFVYACTVLGFASLLVWDIVKTGPVVIPELLDPGLLLELFKRMFTYRPDAELHAGRAVLIVWLVAWAGGRLRAEPSWVDRAGRILGAAWICVSILEFCERRIF
jgi:hypothetical protein